MKRYILFPLLFVSFFLVAQEQWETLPDFPGTSRYAATGFAINGKGYVVTGYNENGPVLFKDTWEYDPDSASWTKKADFAGSARWYASSFVIGRKAYLGCGETSKDFWEYDPALNSWMQKNNFPGTGRAEGISFSVNGKGYFGLGAPYGTSGYLKDIWEYDPLTDTWIRLPDFPGGIRGFAVSFVIGDKAYVGTGESDAFGNVYYNDLWEFNGFTKTWTAKQPLPGAGRVNAVAFSLNGYGYIGMGRAINSEFLYPHDNWRYDPIKDQWNQVSAMPCEKYNLPVTFTIKDTAYVATGWPVGTKFL